jgi:hypothetical protein
VPAIREVLQRMEDGGIGDSSGRGDATSLGSLRLNLFDVLSEIGGGEAIEASLDLLHETVDPLEVAILARNLEEEAPGEYRQEMLQAANDSLGWAANTPREERPDVSPLFELFQAYGGADAVADVKPNTGRWWEYSLMALAGLPEGEGIPTLVDEARDPSVPEEHKSQLPAQMLAQASLRYPEAGGALVDLARSGELSDRAWEAIGGALEGRHLRFPLQLFEAPSLEGNEGDLAGVEAPKLRQYYIESLNMRYEQRLVSANWRDEQIDQQLALIDELLHATSSPTALSVLREAKESLWSVASWGTSSPSPG